MPTTYNLRSKNGDKWNFWSCNSTQKNVKRPKNNNLKKLTALENHKLSCVAKNIKFTQNF